jgi:glucan phosphoethanolaminetransferase (alkaline phosphatase superfamily)
VRGRDAAVAIAVWFAFNVVLSSLMFVFTDDLMSHAVYWLAVFWLLPVIAVALLARDRTRRRLPQASGGSVVLALALAFVAIGAALGAWAALCGAALAVVGVAMLAMERSA